MTGVQTCALPICKNYIAILLYSILTLAKREPVGLVLLLVTLTLLLLGLLFCHLSKKSS